MEITQLVQTFILTFREYYHPPPHPPSTLFAPIPTHHHIKNSEKAGLRSKDKKVSNERLFIF